MLCSKLSFGRYLGCMLAQYVYLQGLLLQNENENKLNKQYSEHLDSSSQDHDMTMLVVVAVVKAPNPSNS
jgi:hypothetical protein